MISSIKNRMPTLVGTCSVASFIVVTSTIKIAKMAPAFFKDAYEAELPYAVCNLGYYFGGLFLGPVISLACNIKLLSEQETTKGKIKNFKISIFTTTVITYALPRVLPYFCNLFKF